MFTYISIVKRGNKGRRTKSISKNELPSTKMNPHRPLHSFGVPSEGPKFTC